MSKLNISKLNQKWRSIMRQACAAELREDFAKLQETFERLVDCKDKAINLLMGELSETERHSSAAHLQCVDRLLELHKSRLAQLDPHWKASLKELSTEYCTDRERLLKLHQWESEYLKAETFVLEQKYAEIYREARLDYQNTCDYIKDMYAVVGSEVNNLEDLDQKELKKYLEAIEEQKENALHLDHAKQELSQKWNDLQKFQGTTSPLHSSESSRQIENEAFACGLRAECMKITQKIQQLKTKLQSAQAAERTRLSNHTMHSYNAIKKLQDIIRKGEMLLRLADACRKLETEHEKVHLFYTSSLNPEELSQEEARAKEAMPEELAQITTDSGNLEGFWERYSKVRLECLCLEREKRVLEKENKQLRILLEQQLQ